MSNFYLNCAINGDHLLLTHMFKGVKTFTAVKYQPHLFIPTQDKSKFKDIYGKPLKKKQFWNMRQARGFMVKEQEKSNAPVYGNANFQYTFLNETYEKNIQYDHDQITIVYLDIEVASEYGFPHPEQAREEVTAITMKIIGPEWVGKPNIMVFGNNDYFNSREDVIYRKFKKESDLLESFLDIWEEIGPDIVTGWYIEFFDIPYLINRIKNVFGNLDDVEGDKQARRLSAWELISERNPLSVHQHNDRKVFDIVGVSTLDYMALYMKFSLKGQESFSLDNIAHVELKKKKISYTEYGGLYQMYKTDYQKFIDYNIRDVELVEELEKKLGYLTMVVSLAYDAKVNFYDVFAQTRMWDTIIYRYLIERDIVLPPKPLVPSEKRYAGAFVKEPIIGVHDYVASFDLDSMYPMIMIQWNISPDTLMRVEPYKFQIDDVLKELPDFEDGLKKINGCISPSGYFFRRDKRGFLPEILIKMYEERVKAKTQAGIHKAEIALINDELKDRNYKGE